MNIEQIQINTQKIVHETVDGEVIVINLESGVYYSFSTGAAVFWSVIEHNPTRAQLVDGAAARFSAPHDEIAQAVGAFLDELVREEIVLLVPAASTSTIPPPTAPPLPFAAPEITKFSNMTDLLLLDPIHDVDQQGWPSKRTA